MRHTPVSFALRTGIALALMALGLLTWGSAPAQADAITNPLHPPLAEGATIRSPLLHPDGERVIFIATFPGQSKGELFLLPVTGGILQKLNGPLVPGGGVTSFRVTPDGSRVVYLADQETEGLRELYSVLLAGGGVTKLSPAQAGAGIQFFQIDPDGRRAVYLGDQEEAGVQELFSVPVDGSSAAVKLNETPARNGDVADFQISSDGSRVVYRADQNLNNVVELFSVATDGTTPPVRISGPMVVGGDVFNFDITPNGSRVVYVADQNSGGVNEIFSVPIQGGIFATLSSPGQRIINNRFAISPDSQRVVFQISFDEPEGSLRSAPIAGGSQSALFSTDNAFVGDFQISRDGDRVLFTVREFGEPPVQLFSVPITGGSRQKLNGNLIPGGEVDSFRLSPDGATVVYFADQEVVDRTELYGVDLASGTVRKLNAPLTATEDVATVAAFDGDGSHLVYAVVDGTTSIQSFFRTAVAQDEEEQRLAAGTELDSVVGFSADGQRVLYVDGQILHAGFDAPQVDFTQFGYFVAEDGSLGDPIALQRSGVTDAAGSMRIQFSDGPGDNPATGGPSLTSGIDYVNNAQTVLFAAGQVTATVSVPLNNDGVAETLETFTLQLFEPVSTTIGSGNVSRATIKGTANSPLLQNTRRIIPENSPDGTALAPALVTSATDLTFSITGGNTEDGFSVDNTGTLRVNDTLALDFEQHPVFALNVRAQDSGGSFDEATVFVSLTDVNERPSFFGGTRSVPENSPNGTLVGTPLSASDPDAGDTITFSTNSSAFAVSSSGQLTVRDGSKLDFEASKSQSFTVNVTDRQGLVRSATVTVNLIDVVEPDPNALRLTGLNPSSATAGGSSFYLKVIGENFTSSSVVRWNGSSRRTIFSSSNLLYGRISSTDIANAGKVNVDVLDLNTGRNSNDLSFPIALGKVGINELDFETSDGAAMSVVDQTSVFTLTWTHTSLTWRGMDEMDLRIRDEEQIPLWIRYTEVFTQSGDQSTLTLLNADGTPAGTGRFGEERILENDTVRLNLAETGFVGSGPQGSTVSVRIPVVFKSAAVGSQYNIELYATDDEGGEQGPDVVGEWAIVEPTLFLPILMR